MERKQFINLLKDTGLYWTIAECSAQAGPELCIEPENLRSLIICNDLVTVKSYFQELKHFVYNRIYEMSQEVPPSAIVMNPLVQTYNALDWIVYYLHNNFDELEW